MAKTRKSYDVWFVSANTVYRAVPYNIVTDWIQQGRLTRNDQLRLSGDKNWTLLTDMPDLSVYLSADDETERVEDVAEALEPVEFEFAWKRRPEDEDEDVDMIPLIDISLVLLVFFMMTATVSSVSRIMVPEAKNTPQVAENTKAFWIGIDRAEDGTPIYSLARGSKAAPPEDDKLKTLAELLDRFDKQIREVSSPVEVRIAAHADIRCEDVARVSTEIETRRVKGILIDTIRAEVNEASKK